MLATTPTASPRRARVRIAALLAMAVLVGGWALLAGVGNAHAMSGRRDCMYVNGQRVPSLNAYRYVVVNYKKSGECPYIDRLKYPSLSINANPVPKLTCEQLSAAVQYESKYYPDICGILAEDTLYIVWKYDRKPFDPNSDIVDLGPVKNFRSS
ncbi:MAG: hypothetical protein JO362_05190 [Streptomycetaceae bacterium]|nr:hypothetical protein [Streptomycetaceae bacterium]